MKDRRDRKRGEEGLESECATGRQSRFSYSRTYIRVYQRVHQRAGVQ